MYRTSHNLAGVPTGGIDLTGRRRLKRSPTRYLWSRYVKTLLFGLEPSDPTTLVAAAVVLAAVGLTAGWVPAFRASRVSPMESLGRH